MLCHPWKLRDLFSRFVFALSVLSFSVLASEKAAAVHPFAIWQSGVVDYFPDTPFGAPESVVGWSFHTADSDEFPLLVQQTNSIDAISNPFPEGPQAPFSITFGSAPFPRGSFADSNGILASDLGGSTASSNDPLFNPFFGSDGNNAYAVALFDELGEMQSYFQVRELGSAATISNALLATTAISNGLWSGVNDYIEFDTVQFAYYAPNSTSPNSPSDYSGFILPEPSSFIMWLLAGGVAIVRRR